MVDAAAGTLDLDLQFLSRLLITQSAQLEPILSSPCSRYPSKPNDTPKKFGAETGALGTLSHNGSCLRYNAGSPTFVVRRYRGPLEDKRRQTPITEESAIPFFEGPKPEVRSFASAGSLILYSEGVGSCQIRGPFKRDMLVFDIKRGGLLALLESSDTLGFTTPTPAEIYCICGGKVVPDMQMSDSD
ncbi:atp-dependent dna helicase recq [Moniliophthora roreri]|nr:atp-dependent dna helicase recq [Moniliophthora roreri]